MVPKSLTLAVIARSSKAMERSQLGVCFPLIPLAFLYVHRRTRIVYDRAIAGWRDLPRLRHRGEQRRVTGVKVTIESK